MESVCLLPLCPPSVLAKGDIVPIDALSVRISCFREENANTIQMSSNQRLSSNNVAQTIVFGGIRCLFEQCVKAAFLSVFV